MPGGSTPKNGKVTNKTIHRTYGYIVFSGSKIIIYGGEIGEHIFRKAEVIDLLNPDLECDVPFHENATGRGAYGGRINDDFVYCGGRDRHDTNYEVWTDKCYKLGQIEPLFNITMSKPRWEEYITHGIVLPNNTLFIIGNRFICFITNHPEIT